jgi:hypothetical protein
MTAQRSESLKVQRHNHNSTKQRGKEMPTLLREDAAEAVDTQVVVLEDEADAAEAVDVVEEVATLLKLL